MNLGEKLDIIIERAQVKEGITVLTQEMVGV